MKSRFGVFVGGGGMISKAEKAPPVKKVLKEMDVAFSTAAGRYRAAPCPAA